jgi:CHAT domain-containing protein/tetratricopeptide (TPR) repeat protein
MVYKMYMNRAIAAGRLKLYVLEEESLSAALRVALEPETKCKCLAYQVWAILQQQDATKLDQAQAVVSQFDRLVTPHMPPPLIAQAETGRAVLSLLQNDVEAARAAVVKAIRLDPTNETASKLMKILLQPNPSAADAWKFLGSDGQASTPEAAPNQPLSPLPEGMVGELVDSGLAAIPTGSVISDREYGEFETKASAHSAAGQYARLEILARQILARHKRPDLRRIFLLHVLAKAVMRQDKTGEALTVSGEAIRIAHQCNDATQLALMLDHHAEILCFRHEYLSALRALAAAEQYLREGKVANSYLNGWIAHTRGLAYQGCGWWDAAATNFRQAIQSAKYFQHWGEWTGATGDFVSLVSEQTEAEGPDPALLEDALHLLESVLDVTSNEPLALQATIHYLTIESNLAGARKDVTALREVQQKFETIFKECGGPHGPLIKPENYHNLFQWTLGICRNMSVMVKLGAVDEVGIKSFFDEQQRWLERAIKRRPRMADLQQEMASLHLDRARHGLDDPTLALHAAADCMEVAMDVLRSLALNYSDPQVRAGWLGNASSMLATLAEIAAFALTEVCPPDQGTAARMVSLAQYFRARSHQDLVRNLPDVQSIPSRHEIETQLMRIRSLHRWLERLDAKGWKKRESPSRDLGAVGIEGESAPAMLLGQTAVEVIRQYPEYTLLKRRGQVEDELQNRKRELAQRISGNTLLRWQATQIESETSFDLSVLQARLRDGEIVLDYYIGPATLHVAVIARQSLRVLRLPVDDMREFRQVIKQHLSPDPIGKGSLAGGMRLCSHWLFPQELVHQLNDLAGWRLYIIASGPLWTVPFPWLDAMGQLVLERWETCLVPAACLSGTNHVMDKPIKAFAVGHPGTAAGFLENVEGEVREVATLMGCPMLFQTEATPQRVLFEVLPQADVIHFACHGECDPISPLMSCLILEPDKQHPDGRLMLHEVLGVPLRATIISMGACHTARSEGPATFPESLAHALLGAGASFVIASLWEADDNECRRFAHEFYTALKQGVDSTTAFHKAQSQQVAKQCIALGRRNYDSFSDRDFASVANFILLSARKPDC